MLASRRAARAGKGRFDAGGLASRGKMLVYAAASRFAQALPPSRIAQQLDNGLGQRPACLGGTKRPVSPGNDALGNAATAEATTGKPAAIASRIDSGMLSSNDGRT